MGNQSAFDFGCSHAVTGNIDNIINTTGNLIVTIFVTAAAVTCYIIAGELFKVGFLETLGIAIDSPHNAGPWDFDAQCAAGDCIFEFFSFVIHQYRLYTEEGQSSHTGFDIDCAGQRCNQNSACFSLPPGVHNGAFATANQIIIPVPGFGVDRLADGTQSLQTGDVAFLHEIIAFFGNRANSSRSGVENVDFVFFYDLPEAAVCRIVGNAFKHDRCCSVAQRPVKNVCVTGNPAQISRAPVHITIMIIENDFMRVSAINKITTRGMHNTFGLSGGA